LYLRFLNSDNLEYVRRTRDGGLELVTVHNGVTTTTPVQIAVTSTKERLFVSLELVEQVMAAVDEINDPWLTTRTSEKW